MRICRTIEAFRDTIRDLRGTGTIGLVPTMGALHSGHLALVNAALTEYDHCVATIFVNPTQFGNPSDLDAYPRTEVQDCAILEEQGVAAVFIPAPSEIYPQGDETIVETTRLANLLHGLVRPGHFRGVTTVVARLFNIAQPDGAFFGEKDYQQLQVIRRMVRDLHFPLAIHAVPTVREADGLAMSSRNQRLSPKDRKAAVVLNQALDLAERAIANGATIEATHASMSAYIASEPRARLQAIDIVEANSLAPVAGQPRTPLGIMVSVEFGPEIDPVLLIDQREITP